MNTIRTEIALHEWLCDRVASSKPQTRATPGLNRLFESIRAEIRNFDYLARWDYECWLHTFQNILRGVSFPGSARSSGGASSPESAPCSEKAIDWLAAVYAEVVAGELDLPVPIVRINRITIAVLGYEHRYLKLRETASVDNVKSTLICEQKFGIKINVKSPAQPSRERP